MSTLDNNERIPIRPVSDLDSLSAKIILAVDGLVKGEKKQGTLTGLLAMNGRNSKVTVSGSLLGEIAAQIGGTIVGLFTPSSVDLYKVPQGVYVVVSGRFPLCVKPQAAAATSLLDNINPEHLLAMLTASDVARGKFVAEGKLNGRPVLQYVIDGPTFLAAAKSSSDPKLRAFAAGLKSAEDADLFIDAKDGYPIAFQGSYNGVFEPIRFDGAFEVQIELLSINDIPPVKLPALCDNPVTI